MPVPPPPSGFESSRLVWETRPRRAKVPVRDVTVSSRRVFLPAGALYELYVYFGDTIRKKNRATSGLTDHGGKLHVYFRDLPKDVRTDEAKLVFEGAGSMLLRTLLEVLPPPAAALPSRVPPPPPLAEAECVAISRFDGSEYGPECSSLAVGERCVPEQPPPSVDAAGCAYGRVGSRLGWFPPKYVIPVADLEEF